MADELLSKEVIQIFWNVTSNISIQDLKFEM